MTAVSAICLLGLAIWFSKTEPLVAAATSCYLLLLGSAPVNFGGCILYFEAAFLSSGRCRFVSPLRLVRSQHRARALCFFLLRKGAEPTSLPRPLSTRFVDSSFRLGRCRLCDFAVSEGGGGFYHHRVSSQLASSTSYFFCHFFRPEDLRRQCGFASFRPRGAPLILRPQASQPPSSTLSSPRPGFVARATSAVSREAASTTALSGVNHLHQTPAAPLSTWRASARWSGHPSIRTASSPRPSRTSAGHPLPHSILPDYEDGARAVRSHAARWVLRRKRQKPTTIARFMVTK